MMIPVAVFSIALWLALGCVGAAAIYLLIVLLGEWKRGELW
jgi:hypothetical protein